MAELNIVGGRVVDDENENLEFKNCSNKLSRDFWPTYSSFANTFGGTIFLGIDDDTREIIGVDDPDKIVKEIWDLLNDDNKVSVNLLSPDDIRRIGIEGKTVIEVRVPRAERRKRPVYINRSMENGTYKRNGGGDYHCSVAELKQLIRDSADSSQDSVPIETMSLDDLDMRSVKSFRERMSLRNPSHPWNDRDDGDFLRLIGACSRDDSGKACPTLAGLLMFGYDYSIMSQLPNYHLDYLELSKDGDNWTHRITSGTGEFNGNIYSFLTEVGNRLLIINDQGKEVDGMERVDDGSIVRAERELLVNALIHADYSGLRGIRAEWRYDRFLVRNPGNLRIPYEDMVDGGISDPRNPHIAVMLGLIGFSERAGSGVSDVFSICRRLGLPSPEYGETVDPETVTVSLMLRSWTSSVDKETAILRMMADDPSVSIDRISEATGMERSKVSRTIGSLKESGRICRVGGTRGRWIVKYRYNRYNDYIKMI